MSSLRLLCHRGHGGLLLGQCCLELTQLRSRVLVGCLEGAVRLLVR